MKTLARRSLQIGTACPAGKAVRFQLLRLAFALGLAGFTPSIVEEFDHSLASLPDHNEAELVIGDKAIERIDALFQEFDPDYLQEHAMRKRRLDQLAAELFERTAAGSDTQCSDQIFLEAKWLVGYTAWWSRIDARLDELEGSFAIEDQAFAALPSQRDGLYGRCATEKFIKIEATAVNYFDMAGGWFPLVERKPIETLRDSEKMTSFTATHVISDVVKTGQDYRSKLGGLASIMAATDKRDDVMEMIRTSVRGPDSTRDQQEELRDHFNRLVNWWQDPETGFWGAWYQEGEGFFKTTDLSITYHLGPCAAWGGEPLARTD